MIETLDDLISAQEGRCAICCEIKPLVRDHNHETGYVRGLLCQGCNRMLGIVRDSPVVLARAIEYLNREQTSVVYDDDVVALRTANADLVRRRTIEWVEKAQAEIDYLRAERLLTGSRQADGTFDLSWMRATDVRWLASRFGAREVHGTPEKVL
jgi:hypothetical protein